MIVKAKTYPFTILRRHDGCCDPYPYLRSDDGDKTMTCISPNHGRSFVMAQCGGRYIVSKGNGLSYTTHPFINTGEMGCDTWGLLLKQDALRDFTVGMEIESLGIKTNRMEYVLEIEREMVLPNGCVLKPTLLQYSVESPYRICDIPFLPKRQVETEISKWRNMSQKKAYHMMAADVLTSNLRTLHDNGILHNAIHFQNFTLALELLDFELACTPKTPYTNDDDRRHVKDLLPREVMQTYEVVNQIAWLLGEDINYAKVDGLFADKGFTRFVSLIT